MKKTLWILAGTLMFGSAALADSACGVGTAASYEGTSCFIGNLDFQNFDFIPSGTTHVTLGSITITPITTPGNQGFQFNLLLSVNHNTASVTPATEDLTTDFTVVANSGLIDDLYIQFGGSYTGTGQSSFSETYGCPGVDCGNFNVTNPPTNLTNQVNLTTPVTSLSISKDVGVTTGTGVGSAQVSQFINQFSNTVPEPTYTGLLIAGLLGLGWLRRHRQSQV